MYFCKDADKYPIVGTTFSEGKLQIVTQDHPTTYHNDNHGRISHACKLCDWWFSQMTSLTLAFIWQYLSILFPQHSIKKWPHNITIPGHLSCFLECKLEITSGSMLWSLPISSLAEVPDTQGTPSEISRGLQSGPLCTPLIYLLPPSHVGLAHTPNSQWN